MIHNRIIPLLLLLSVTTVSCIKGEPANMECDILSAQVDASFAEYFYKASQMSTGDIPSGDRQIVFTVRSLISLPRAVPVTFTLSEGATISPENGSVQDFTAGPVVYTVTSEDDAWKREYEVLFREAALPSSKLSFEHFEEEGSMVYTSTKYHAFYELDESGNRQDIWASGNAGVAIMNEGWTPEQFPTYATPSGYSGYGLCLNTQSAGILGQMFGKPIAAGNLFIGRFIIDNVMTDALKTTDFGTPIAREPARVTGWYKYSPGSEFTDKNMNTIEGRTDEANIYGVFWRNTDEDGNEVKLDGTNILTSHYIVRRAQVASLPPTEEWTRFEMFFEGERADAAILAGMGYSFTLVFSSSKGGDSFEGAVGSTLYVDEVELSFEEE
ncbi:MAG: PCMD domain-containing protein [Bacteroidales bacterium]|nr:PCMD domain-containing protein [Bacteroidales bacterium]